MNTLLLNPGSWDLVIDAGGNIAMATDPYSLAQDAASAIKLFLGEYWYDTTIGVPYNPNILGSNPGVPPPSIPYLKSQFITAALTVPEVVKARVFFSAMGSDRVLRGQVQIENAAGQQSATGF